MLEPRGHHCFALEAPPQIIGTSQEFLNGDGPAEPTVPGRDDAPHSPTSDLIFALVIVFKDRGQAEGGARLGGARDGLLTRRAVR